MADTWIPRAGPTERDAQGFKVDVTYVNQRTNEKVGPETFRMNITLEQFKAQVRAKVDELQETSPTFKIAPGTIDTTPVAVVLTAAQIARKDYDTKYQVSARAQQAVRDGVLLANHADVTKASDDARAAYKAGYLSS